MVSSGGEKFVIQFVLGRSASGKTTYLYSLAQKSLKDGPVFLIVPEQESMNTERLCMERFGDGVQVLSFRRLCDTLMRRYGGGAKPRLGEVARLGILYRAVQSVKRKLVYYRKSADKVRFYEKLLPVMEDFAAYQINADKLLPLLEGHASLAKYQDLLLIYESYNALRTQDYRDQFDDLDTVAKLLADHKFFEGATVLIDNFGGFTAQEYAILESIFLQAEHCALALTADRGEVGLFAPTLHHLERLKRLTEQLGLATKEVICKGQYRYNADNLRRLEKYLFSAKRPAALQPSDGSVRILSATDPEKEVRMVAQDIRERVLGGQCRYQDISVVSNVQQEYQTLVEMVFDDLEIPLYSDRKVDVLSRPLFGLLLRAMDAVQYNYRFEDMFSMAGTYLCGLDHDETARLENYVHLWNISGKKWEMEWTQNPFGLDASETKEQVAQELARINQLRRRLIGPLMEFAEDTRAGKARDLLAALWRLSENYGVKEKLKEYALAEGDRAKAEEWLRLYDLLIELLDQLALVLGEQEISRKTLRDIMEVCLRGYSFGVVPAFMDQVHFGDMIRARSGEVKHIYVLGAVGGKFPAGVSGSNMITDSDIRHFKSQNVLLSKDSMTVASEQQFCLYRTLSTASDSITFCFSTFSSAGKPQLAAGPLLRIKDKLLEIEVIEDKQIMTHAKDLLRYLMPLPDGEERKKLQEFLQNEFGIDATQLNKRPEENEALPRALVEALYGKELSASQSRLESFVGCPFGFFLKYGLKLNENRPASFAANYIGNFVHYGLEKLIGAVSESSLDLWDYTKTDAFMETVAEKYCSEHFVDMESPRFNHLYDRIKRTMMLAGRSAVDELKCSKFAPALQEHEFNEMIPLKNGMSARVNGIIDRVDTAKIDGQQWLKIMDYKTGDKRLDFSAIYNGYQLQLPLYAAMLRTEERFKDARIAALEYFLAEVPTFDQQADDPTALPAKLAKAFPRRGVYADNVELLRAVDGSEKQSYTNVQITSENVFKKDSPVAPVSHLEAFGSFARKKTEEIAQRIASGEVSVCPMKQGVNACEYCKFDGICRFEYGKSSVQRYQKLTQKEFFEKITEGEE